MWTRALTALLLAVVGLSAIVAGYGFLGTPDGSAVGIPREWLSDSPFPDYRVPGAVLTALGALYLFSAFREWRRARDAWFWAGLSGGAMIVWIAAQVWWMGYDRHPMQTILQAAVLMIGVVVGALALRELRARRAEGARA